MRLLGIDYGTKRVGIAISDEAGQFALPHSVVTNGRIISKGPALPDGPSNGLSDEIEKIAKENEIREIVLGESKNYKGESNKIMVGILELKKQLEIKGFTAHLEPEFMTSVQAERFQGKNKKTDASAAALILQAYLDKEKGGRE